MERRSGSAACDDTWKASIAAAERPRGWRRQGGGRRRRRRRGVEVGDVMALVASDEGRKPPVAMAMLFGLAWPRGQHMG